MPQCSKCGTQVKKLTAHAETKEKMCLKCLTGSGYFALQDHEIVGEDEPIRATYLNAMVDPPWESWTDQPWPSERWSSGMRADADGDGVTDSRWVQLGSILGPKWERLYAAVRIIDQQRGLG